LTENPEGIDIVSDINDSSLPPYNFIFLTNLLEWVETPKREQTRFQVFSKLVVISLGGFWDFIVATRSQLLPDFVRILRKGDG
jgi:hypothetical protein